MFQLSSHKMQVLVKPEMNGNYENYQTEVRIIYKLKASPQPQAPKQL